MNILITGASGFIGQHLAKSLEEKGNTVMRMHHTLLLDKKQLPNMSRIFPDIDYIFHLAAYGNMAHQKDTDEIFEATLTATYNLLKATKNISYKGFVNVSSSSVLLPHQTLYAATKRGAEELCRAFAHEYGKPIISVRPSSVYGPGEASFRFIPTVFRSCLTGEQMVLDPTPGHDLIYIDDVVGAMKQLSLTAMQNKGTAYTLATGISTQNSTVVAMIESLTGKKAVTTIKEGLRSFDTSQWTVATDLIPRVTLAQGLKKYYESIT